MGVLTAVEWFKIWWCHHLKWIGPSLRLRFLHRLLRVHFKTTHVLISEHLLDQTLDKESIKYQSHLNLSQSSPLRKLCRSLDSQITWARETQLTAQWFKVNTTRTSFPDHTPGSPNSPPKLPQSTPNRDNLQNPNLEFATAGHNSLRPKIWSSRTLKQSMSSDWSCWRRSLRGSSRKMSRHGGKGWTVTSRLWWRNRGRCRSWRI